MFGYLGYFLLGIFLLGFFGIIRPLAFYVRFALYTLLVCVAAGYGKLNKIWGGSLTYR